MDILNLNFDTKDENQESDLIIWEDCGDKQRPNILYDSSKTNNVMDVKYSVIDGITKIELL